jgi:hypothetical protein
MDEIQLVQLNNLLHDYGRAWQAIQQYTCPATQSAHTQARNSIVAFIKRVQQPTQETRPVLPFTHWSKDPLIPYDGCNCSSCDDARTLVSNDVSDNTLNRGVL